MKYYTIVGKDLPDMVVQADSFDEAIAKARTVSSNYVGGYAVDSFLNAIFEDEGGAIALDDGTYISDYGHCYALIDSENKELRKLTEDEVYEMVTRGGCYA